MTPSGLDNDVNKARSLSVRSLDRTRLVAILLQSLDTINPACNGGCDPTNGFTATPTLLGSITHVQDIDGSLG